MERLKRDVRILRPQLLMVLKLLIIMNVCLGGILLLMFNFPSGDEIIPLKMMAFTLMLGVNGGLVLGLLLKYFSEWRKFIQEEVDEREAEEKYPFITNRFNNKN